MDERLIFAPEAVIRIRDGRIVVQAGGNAFASDEPMLIAWLLGFARPVAPDTMLARVAPADRGEAQRVLGYLVQHGALVRAAEAAPVDASVAFARARKLLPLTARALYDLGCDLEALGPEADVALAARTGIGVEDRLAGIAAAVDQLRGGLDPIARERVERQRRGFAIGPGTRGLKLHIGCGPHWLDGWVNIDVDPAPFAVNVIRGLPFADGSASHVFVSHLLEHLYFPRDVLPFIAELKRVLAPGGRVRIVVPDVARAIAAYVESDARFFESRREIWSWWPENPTRLEDFLAYAGAGPEPSYLFESHKFGYDFETLAKVLSEAGFVAIGESRFMQSIDPVLRVDDASAVAKAHYGDQPYSLFVEALAPPRTMQ